MFPLRALCFIISLSRTPQFPLDPILLSSLRLLRSRTRIPLRCIRSLVYIFRVLVLYYLRTNITCLSSYLSEVPLERSETPVWLRPSCPSVTFGSDRIWTYRGKRQKGESGGQLLTVHHRTRAGRTKARTEETKDGWSRAGGSERSEEPQTETREK